MRLEISNLARDKIENAILLTGSARSGTTILGKVLHSFKAVEYDFEPPMLFTLFPLVSKIPEQEWRILYETYLYEDFFINAVSGRGINCNLIDDSSIYNVKSIADIEKRLKRSIGKVEAEHQGADSVIAVKIPDIVSYLPKVVQYYSAMRVIIMRRDAVGTINSLLAKGWYSDEGLTTNQIWPFRRHHNMRAPFWVSESDLDRWVEMTEVDRCAYYYIQTHECLDQIPGRIEIRYEELLREPFHTIQNLAKKLDLEFGEMTNKIIASIKPTPKSRDMAIMEKVSPQLSEVVYHYSNK